MQRTTVVSSSILGVGYAAQECLLEVEFVNGGVYQYRDVPMSAFAALLEAPSKGQHVNWSIKGRYRYERVGSVRR